jgi:hypothetical protein
MLIDDDITILFSADYTKNRIINGFMIAEK